MSPHRKRFEIHPQPDDATCGPTCLHAVYRFFGDDVPLDSVIDEVRPLDSGGTLAVFLALHALKRGYRATIHTYNLQLFDPTWFWDRSTDLSERLAAQAKAKPDKRLRVATRAYQEYLELGGVLRFAKLSGRLIGSQLERGIPVLTGLSATYLYESAREVGETELRYDDVQGTPTGHFVVLHGLDRNGRVRIADPFHDNPRFSTHAYSVSMERLIGAILLGVLTYDANLLVLQPARRRETHGRRR